MRKYTYITLLTLVSVFILSCGDKKNNDAIQYLNNIQNLYKKGYYSEALQKIDSIQILYPKAFEEIKSALALQQEVRRASDMKQITQSDSLIAIYQPKVDSLKTLFTYRKDKEDEKGEYLPKATFTNSITATALRSGINEDGTLYLESTYIGGQLHNKVGAVTKDKQSAESLTIEDDGFNFRFTNLGQQYEVIKITHFHDNGLAKFIYENSNNPLTIQLKGKNTTSFSLSNIQKKAIADSYLLSELMLLQDSLLTAKDKASIRIKYLDSKKNEQPEKTEN